MSLRREEIRKDLGSKGGRGDQRLKERGNTVESKIHLEQYILRG